MQETKMSNDQPQFADWDVTSHIPVGTPEAEAQRKMAKIGLVRDLSNLKSCMLITIQEVMQLTGLGRTRIYQELAGPLQSVRVGRRRLVPAEALEAWRAGLRPGHGRSDGT